MSPAECMSFQEGEMELALQLLASHNGEMSPVRVCDAVRPLYPCCPSLPYSLWSPSIVTPLVFAGSGAGGGLAANQRARQQGRAHRLVLRRGAALLQRSAAVSSQLVLSLRWYARGLTTFPSLLVLRRYGDNIKKVWELKFEDSKKIEEVQEFFLRIYPHTQLGGAKRVVSVYHRGELAAAGFPDGEQSGSEEEDEEDDEEDDGEDEGEDREGDSQQASDSDGSSINSVSNDGSDDDEEGELEAARGGRRPLGASGKAVAAKAAAPAPPAAPARRVRMQGGDGKDSAALKPSASSGALSTVSSNASGKRAGSSTASEALAADSSERRSGRKRGQGANEDTSPPAPAKQKAEPAAADEGAKRRRR